jgi:intron-binding protein aquarius
MADVILSLTRTSRVGYLRDIRRLTVALSRARLGLYILGRREVFESCFELRPAFDILLRRPDKLMLSTGELWPSQRILADEENKPAPGETAMEGVEHLGQYVYEMTKSKVEQIRAERGLAGIEETEENLVPADEAALEDIAEEFEAEEEDLPADETAREDMAEGFEAEEEE